MNSFKDFQLEPSLLQFMERHPAVDISSINFLDSKDVKAAGISLDSGDQLEKVKFPSKGFES